jgi:hypothetical protein
VVLLALAAAGLAFQGPPVFTALRFAPPQADLRPPAGVEQVSGSPAPREIARQSQLDLSWVTVALVVLAVVVVIALVWRALRRRLRPALPGAPAEVAGSAEGAVAPEPPRQPRPERVRRGLDRALDLLGEQREPRDAIERAWLGLEEGAADSGVRRLPAETPGEFVARVVARVASDRAAARSLLELYLRVRFGDAPVTAVDVDAARAAIEALRDSWSGASAGAGTGAGTGAGAGTGTVAG